MRIFYIQCDWYILSLSKKKKEYSIPYELDQLHHDKLIPIKYPHDQKLSCITLSTILILHFFFPPFTSKWIERVYFLWTINKISCLNEIAQIRQSHLIKCSHSLRKEKCFLQLVGLSSCRRHKMRAEHFFLYEL